MNTSELSPLQRLLGNQPHAGIVEWISVRPARGELQVLSCVAAAPGKGLLGDRYCGSSGTREVTLLQFEHLAVVASLLRRETLDPAILRRNIALSGISVAGLQRARFRIGSAVLEGTGPCDPCSKIDLALGPGGYVAMLGHGGITARVVEAGEIGIGHSVEFIALRPLTRKTSRE